jgi:hypothetical protein
MPELDAIKVNTTSNPNSFQNSYNYFVCVYFVQVGLDMCMALKSLHRMGVIHR